MLSLSLLTILPSHAGGPTNSHHVPKFHEIKDVKLKKRTFINFLIPIIQEINQDILELRTRVVGLHRTYSHDKELSARDSSWINYMAKKYRVRKFSLQSDSKWQELIRKIDIVPVSLVIAQAANESAWGTSRFARHGNNYFGQWCFKAGCGIVPHHRNTGLYHEIQSFKSVKAAVESYIHNLNSHYAYEGLRSSRATLRSKQQKIRGVVLANGLLRYSDKGSAYIRAIQGLIRSNRLEQYQQLI